MGKLYSNDKEATPCKQKRWLRNSQRQNKYLKPGALGRLRYYKTKSRTDLGMKRIVVLDDDKPKESIVVSVNTVIDNGHMMVSPQKFGYPPAAGSTDLLMPTDVIVRIPNTPRADDMYLESRLESLPMDLLVNILCNLHHDQLKPVFHVSQRIRNAVLIARQFHFNYTTPDRYRQDMLSTITPIPTNHWPFTKKGDGKTWMPSPRAPRAPRHALRPSSRVKQTDVRQITAVLFQESAFPAVCMVPSVLQRPQCSKSLASNRALFYEEELCQAVAQNKLR